MNVFDLSWMVGKFITRVRFVEPIQWTFLFDATAGLGVECRWRLLHGGRIAISDANPAQTSAAVAASDIETAVGTVLGAQAITRVAVRDGTADLLIDFGDSLRLEIMPFSRGDEGWNLTSPAGTQIVAIGGELKSF